jgi:ATP-binding cassette subfamily B protein
MLSQHFGMFFRRRPNLICRILVDQLQRTGSLSFPLYGVIVEAIGLHTQRITILGKSFIQLETSALVLRQESLAVLYEAL